MTQPKLIVITPPNDYKRYQGKSFTHHVQSDGRSLTAAEVELLRTDPERFYSDSDEPEAA